LEAFSHFASYCPLQGVVRSFLVSRSRQVVSSAVLDREFRFAAGETIYTEQSQKYTEQGIDQLARASGFQSVRVITDERRWYALVVWRRTAEAG
ncbi:MAG: L-histidine N(alpha)-methyltransferase, partial [Pseudomonas sp.]